jgi:hypothetical protein
MADTNETAKVRTCASPERRRLLRNLAVLAGAPLAGSCINSYVPKVQKAAAAYQPYPQGNMRCGQCLYFIAPAANCRIVEGFIRDGDWCRFWTPRKGPLTTVTAPAQ